MSVRRKSITSDLARIDKLRDTDIDYSDIPALDDVFFQKALVTLPHKKVSITLRVDHEVLSFFKNQGKGYQTLMNAVLKTYVASQQKLKPTHR